ncbi:hypothetical protein [Couchioplanes azureus]|uniref:hypothetical protein n=1 Tax=Couchioplanes caeruleus TaxID=56438 RepID=UPI001670D327|nr:hypothetical protein [Couchioplanes caeruleus]GGQ49386.1 hypothetical protein GCM10010166_17220 [Couchioplanes caeruleus subsp. azureus]
MVTRRIAEALLRLAVRRWPARLRDDLRREWAAELHVLAGEARAGAMLRFAASLAVARPAREPGTAAARAGALWRALRLTVVAPLTAAAVFLVAIVVAGVLLPDTGALQYAATTLLLGAGAVLLARLGRWWTVGGAATTTLVLAVTVPGCAAGFLQYALSGNSAKLATHGPAYLIFFGGLGALLPRVDRLAATGRRARAWWIGALGALALADAAVMVPVFLATGTPHPASAPLWLFTALTASGFGLPSPAGWEIFTILDQTELDPQIFLLCTGIALGAVMFRAPARTETADLSAPSS